MPTTLPTLIAFMVMVIVLMVVLYCVKLVMDWMELPPPIRTVAMLIVGIVALWILLSRLGIVT